jgi:hypothetical protein
MISVAEQNDVELVGESLSGNRDAFGQIVSRYQFIPIFEPLAKYAQFRIESRNFCQQHQLLFAPFAGSRFTSSGLRPPSPIQCGEGIILWDDFPA